MNPPNSIKITFNGFCHVNATSRETTMSQITNPKQLIDLIQEYGYHEKIRILAVEGTTVTLLGAMCYDEENGGVCILPKAVFGAGMDQV